MYMEIFFKNKNMYHKASNFCVYGSMSDPVTHSQIRNSDQFLDGGRGFIIFQKHQNFPAIVVLLRIKCENPRQGSVMWSVNQVCWPGQRSWRPDHENHPMQLNWLQSMQLCMTTTTFLAIRPLKTWINNSPTASYPSQIDCNHSCPSISMQLCNATSGPSVCRQHAGRPPFTSAAVAVECW